MKVNKVINKKRSSSSSNKKKYGSLRSVLIFWFVIFSIIPLLFMGWYSVFKFEKALNNEVSQRLLVNGREIESIFADYQRSLTSMRDKYVDDQTLAGYLQNFDSEPLKEIGNDWLNKTPLTALTFYDRNGRQITSVYRDDRGQIRAFELSAEKILLNEKYLSSLKDKSDIGFVDQDKEKLSLIMFSKITQSNGKTIGYFEQIIDLKDSFLVKIKNKLKVESFLVTENRRIFASSKSDFKNLKLKVSDLAEDKFLNFEFDNQNYGFILYPFMWDKSKFYIALGSIQNDSQNLLKNINIAFVSVISIVSILLLATIFITTALFLKPIHRLIDGFRAFEKNEQLIQLPVTSKTEIGLLTEAFNEMSYKIFSARHDLKKKIKELENTNKELKDAQAKLVHSAKMTSLGQLVAGVAHELNNPIGFIFSNMTQLQEYSSQLFHLIQISENDPQQIAKTKNEIDYDFIKSDMPRLIRSCLDGAQRTRDIVVGLRNFSRLEEAQLKEVDLREALDTTLEILQGEIKNRIQVHRQYENVPRINCFASQINQVFMNILSNAVHAISGQGQIWLTVQALKSNRNQPARVQVSIQDSGSGMDPQTLEKIFEPFFTTKGVGQGTGLGLSISYGIIQNHGGEIQVRSQKGVGTEFVIILPISPPLKVK